MRIYIVFVKLPIDDSSENTSFTKIEQLTPSRQCHLSNRFAT